MPQMLNKTTGMSFSHRALFTIGKFKQCPPQQRPAAREDSCNKAGCLPPKTERQGNSPAPTVVGFLGFFFSFSRAIFGIFSQAGQTKQTRANVVCQVSGIVLICIISSLEGALPAEWASESGSTMKRNMVVADDTAFRERSKLLTSMERQKWLNSYMQKLLVVQSS